MAKINATLSITYPRGGDGRPYREPITGTPVSKVVQSATIPVASVRK